MSNLVIVESPAKAKTIEKFLGKGYTVKASIGHIRDLPKSKLGVDIENNFEPSYITIRGKASIANELKKEAKFELGDFDRAARFIVLTGDETVDNASIKALENLREILANTTKSLDIVKYCLPECYKTELTWSVNARSLQNFLSLRSSKSALWEIRNLSLKLYESLPQEHKFIFEDHVNQE